MAGPLLFVITEFDCTYIITIRLIAEISKEHKDLQSDEKKVFKKKTKTIFLFALHFKTLSAICSSCLTASPCKPGGQSYKMFLVRIEVLFFH